MNPMSHTDALVTQAASICRAEVLEVEPDGAVLVMCDGQHQEPLACDLLHADNGQSCLLTPGDAVLVWYSGCDNERGVVLGRVGPTRAMVPEAKNSAEDVPDELVLEAKKGLTLKCGDGSITIRADGKILIKGKDLVSHARRSNRIKGGSVAIN